MPGPFQAAKLGELRPRPARLPGRGGTIGACRLELAVGRLDQPVERGREARCVFQLGHERKIGRVEPEGDGAADPSARRDHGHPRADLRQQVVPRLRPVRSRNALSERLQPRGGVGIVVLDQRPDGLGELARIDRRSV